MSDILNQLNSYLVEMAAPTTTNVNRAIQLLDWMSNPKYAARIGQRKNGTGLSADKILDNVMAAIKKNLPQYKDLKKIKNPEEMLSALVAIIDTNPSIKNLQFTELMDAQQDILNVWNSLQSVISRDKKKEREVEAGKLGVAANTKTGASVPKEQKRTNKDIDKELESINKILDAERKTPRYKKMIQQFTATDSKSINSDAAAESKGKSLTTAMLNSHKLSEYLPDLDNSKIPGVADAVKAIKELLLIAHAEHKAYQDADPKYKKDILTNAKYLETALKGLRAAADNAKKGFGITPGPIKKGKTTIKKMVASKK